MKKISLTIWLALLFLTCNLINIGYMTWWHLGNLEEAILESHLMPLTKLWFLNYHYFLFFHPSLVKGVLNPWIVLLIIFVAHIAAIAGLVMRKRWGRRISIYILLTMCVVSFFWPRISQDATTVMEVYMRRAHNGWVYDKYWQPLKLTYCTDCEYTANHTRQYEPIYYHDLRHVPESYAQAKAFTDKIFLEQAPSITHLGPAYWGIFKMSEDAFQTSWEMYQIIFSLALIIFYIWFLILPVLLWIALVKINFRSGEEDG